MTLSSSSTSSSAKSLLQQAEAKLSSSKKSSVSWWLTSIFSPHGSSESSIEKAAELFGQAANKFKVEKHWSDAGSAFLRMASCYSLLGEVDDELSALVSAASCYKKSETPQKSLEPLITAAQGYLNRGRLHTAAKQFRDLGELYEILAEKPIEMGACSTPSTEQHFLKAIEMFQKASDIFIGEDAVATSNACLIKAGMLAALHKDFALAVKIFEEMARQSLSPSLAKWSVKDYLFRASLCMLASRDYDDIIESLKEDDLEVFNSKVSEFDRICPLDAWKSTLLLLVKERFDEEESLS